VQKLIELSLIFATFAIPIRFAKAKNPREGFRKMVIYMIAFYAFYLFCLRFLHGRFAR
jgi:hypothetical protein